MTTHVCMSSVCPCKTLREYSLLILALGHHVSQLLSIHGFPSILCARGSYDDKMRTDIYRPWWRKHHHQPRQPLLSLYTCSVILYLCVCLDILCELADSCKSVCKCFLWGCFETVRSCKTSLISFHFYMAAQLTGWIVLWITEHVYTIHK